MLVLQYGHAKVGPAFCWENLWCASWVLLWSILASYNWRCVAVSLHMGSWCLVVSVACCAWQRSRPKYPSRPACLWPTIFLLFQGECLEALRVSYVFNDSMEPICSPRNHPFAARTWVNMDGQATCCNSMLGSLSSLKGKRFLLEGDLCQFWLGDGVCRLCLCAAVHVDDPPQSNWWSARFSSCKWWQPGSWKAGDRLRLATEQAKPAATCSDGILDLNVSRSCHLWTIQVCSPLHLLLLLGETCRASVLFCGTPGNDLSCIFSDSLSLWSKSGASSELQHVWDSHRSHRRSWILWGGRGASPGGCFFRARRPPLPLPHHQSGRAYGSLLHFAFYFAFFGIILDFVAWYFIFLIDGFTYWVK